MALIQINVDDAIKARADEAFARSGITTPMAMRMMVTQVANEGRTPFDGIFLNATAAALAEDVRRDMVYAEAVELGLIHEESRDAFTLSNAVLDELGITAKEIGQ